MPSCPLTKTIRVDATLGKDVASSQAKLLEMPKNQGFFCVYVIMITIKAIMIFNVNRISSKNVGSGRINIAIIKHEAEYLMVSNPLVELTVEYLTERVA